MTHSKCSINTINNDSEKGGGGEEEKKYNLVAAER